MRFVGQKSVVNGECTIDNAELISHLDFSKRPLVHVCLKKKQAVSFQAK